MPAPKGTLAVYRELIRMRRDHPWLVDGRLTTTDVTAATMAIHVRADDEHLTLFLNAGDEVADVGGVEVGPHSYVIAS